MTASARCPTTSTIRPRPRSFSRKRAIRTASISANYIVVAANPLDVACAQILQQQWQAAGITVKITPMETAPLLNMWSSGTWPTLLSVALSWTPDADAIFQYVKSDSKFGTAMGIARPRARPDDRRGARRPRSRKPRRQEPGRSRRHIAENAYVIQIYQYPLRWEIWWNYVKGYVPLAANIRSYVRTTWLKK